MLGLGAVGVITAAAAAVGATVIATDPSDERRDLAVSLGIPAVDPTSCPSACRRRACRCCSSCPAPHRARGALDLLAHEGTALVGSWYGGSRSSCRSVARSTGAG